MDRSRHCDFTGALIEALEGREGSDADGDGKVTLEELGRHIARRVLDRRLGWQRAVVEGRPRSEAWPWAGRDIDNYRTRSHSDYVAGGWNFGEGGTLAKSRPNPSQPLTPLGNQHRLLSFVYLGSFLDDWVDLGLGEPDLEALEKLIMDRPEVGVVMPGTGGLRKVRFASTKGNKGKSGSERVCYALFPRPGLVADGHRLREGRQGQPDRRGAERGQGDAHQVRGAAR